MVDPVGLVKGVLDTLQTIDGAVNAVPELKTTLRRRYGDYASVLETLESKPEVVIAKEIERELGRLKELFTMVANLIAEYTAAPGDGKGKKLNAMTKRAADYKDVNEKLKEIDGEVMRQLTIMCVKEAISELEMETMRGIDAKVDRATSLLQRLQPPRLPNMAAVPVGSLTLPDSYVERPGLKEVVDGLMKPDQVIGPYIVLGMGGTGKTLMASAVVNDSSVRGHFRGGIFWIRVGRGGNKRLLPLLQGLAREVGVAATDAPHGVPHQFDNLEHVKQHLAVVATTGTRPRLVVLDDVWEREVMDALRPMGFQLLVTTRDRSVVGEPGGCTVVGDMTDEEALKLLLRTSRTVGPWDDVRTSMMKVVAVCGRLPLVLAIAGSMPVVKGNGLTVGPWEELIKTFQNKATKRWAEGEEGTSLNTVLSASFVALSAQKKAELLKMAVLAAGAVAPIAMLLNLWETKDVQGTRDEAEGLVSRCLLQVGDSGYRVHDLLLEFVRDEIKRDGNEDMLKMAIERQAQYLGRLDVVRGYHDPVHGPGKQGLYVLDALWRSLEELSGDTQLEAASYRTSLEKLERCVLASADMANSCWEVGRFFNIQGKYEEADPLYRRAAEINEKRFGRDHPNVATDLIYRTGLLHSQGKYEEADPLYQRALAIDEKVHGRYHLAVATDLNNWAVLLTAQGRYDEAEPRYKRSLDIREIARGPVQPEVAESLNNRAGLLYKQGQYAEAAAVFQRALTILEKSLGPDHPNMTIFLSNRAGMLVEQGRYADADALYERSLTILEESLRPEHPLVATVLNNRARLLGQQGKYDDAEPLFRRATEIWEKVHGREHPLVATALNNRAELLRKQGKDDKAEPLYARAIAVGEKALGPEHPDLAIWLNNLAGLLKSQERYAEAEPLYERSLAIRDKMFGPDHTEVTAALDNRAVWVLVLSARPPLVTLGKYDEADPVIGRFHPCSAVGGKYPDVAEFEQEYRQILGNMWCLEDQGKYKKADLLYSRAQEILRANVGEKHFAYAVALNIRAESLEKRGKYEEADPLYGRILDILSATEGEEHPDNAPTLNDFASRLNERAGYLEVQGKHEEADRMYLSIIKNMEDALGREHPLVATALNNRAQLLKEQGKYEEAHALYKRALGIDEKVHGPNHPDVARDLHNRARLLGQQGKYDDAEPLYLRVTEILEKVHGREHPLVATALNDRAGLLLSQGRYAETELLFERSLAIREMALGPYHPEVAESLTNRAGLLYKQSKYEEADSLFARALAIDDKVYRSDHPDAARDLNNRAGLLRLQGKHDEAMPLLGKALAIRMNKLVERYIDTVNTQKWLEAVRNTQVAPKG